jgi:acetoacetate decarboxylase
MADCGDYPPPPWRLRGEAAIVVVGVRDRAARRFPRPAGVQLLTAGGWTLGGALLARYDEHATLTYHELIVFSGLARAAGRLAFVVSHIYVDSLRSLRAGRKIWGLPKELADFTWASRNVTVDQHGQTLLQASFRHRGKGLPLPLYAPVFGDRAARAVRAAGRGLLRGSPALAEFEVPPASPLAGLGMGGRHLGVAGDGLDLRFPGARVIAKR